MATFNINTTGFTPTQQAAVASAAKLGQVGNTVTTTNAGNVTGTYQGTTTPEQQTAAAQQQSIATPTTLNSGSLTPAPTYTLPTPAPASGLGTDAMTNVGAQNSVYQNALSAAATAQDKATNSTSGTDSLQSHLNLLLGIPQKEDVLSNPDVVAAHNSEVTAQNEVTHQTSLLNAITTKQQQDLLTTRGTASANGVTEAVYGGQANEINREAAIQALPVAAAVAVAQGNLKLAQDNLTYMTQVVTEKVNNAYDYKTAVYNSVNDFVNKSEAATLDALKTKAANDHQDQVNNLNFAQSLVSGAIAQGSVNSGVVSSMLKLMQNPASPTFGQDIGTLASQIKQNPQDVAYKQAQINSLNATAASKVPVGGFTTPVVPQSYTLKAGDDPFNIAQRNGIDMATLQSLNPNVSNWHTLPVGFKLNLPSTGGGVPGSTGNAAINATANGYSTQPAPGAGGLTQASIDQKALSYVMNGTLPPQGRTGVAGLQNAAISNRMAELDPNGTLAGNKAEIKSYSESLATQQKYLDTTQRAFNTANDTLASLQSFMSKNNINASQFPDINSFSNYLKAKGIDPGAAGGYNAQIATLRAEYSQVLAKGGVRSVETDQQAAKLIPDGLAPAQLAKVAAQIQVDGTNVTNDAQKQVQQIQTQINGIIGGHATAASAPSTNLTQVATSKGISPTDLQTAIDTYGQDAVMNFLNQ